MKKHLVLPGFLTLIGCTILVTLGMWQLQRLEWKNSLITKLETAQAESRRLPILTKQDLKQNFTFKRGKIKGRFLNGKNILIKPRTYNGKVGQHFYTAFKMARSGHIVWINKGWVPNDFALLIHEPGQVRTQTIIGTFKAPPRPNSFTPNNDTKKNIWYHPVLETMSQSHNLKNTNHNYIFILEENNSKATYPIKKAIKISYKNDHFLYALFWFAMSGVLLIIFWLRFLKIPQKKEQKKPNV